MAELVEGGRGLTLAWAELLFLEGLPVELHVEGECLGEGRWF